MGFYLFINAIMIVIYLQLNPFCTVIKNFKNLIYTQKHDKFYIKDLMNVY
jgi:hypothetical protein